MTAAGVWIYTLDNSNAAMQALDPGEARSATEPTRPSPTLPSFHIGAGQINLAAFGALAFLHMTSTSTSVPPHTLAWIYNPTSNETIIYVNPTDRSLDIGDSDLLEIHLQGVVSVAELDFVYEPEAACRGGFGGNRSCAADRDRERWDSSDDGQRPCFYRSGGERKHTRGRPVCGPCLPTTA